MNEIETWLCSNIWEWYGTLSVFSSINTDMHSFAVPILANHRYVRKMIRQYVKKMGHTHNYCKGPIGQYKDVIMHRASLFKQEFGDEASRKCHDACIWTCYLANQIGIMEQSEFSRCIPSNIHESLRYSSECNIDISEKEDIVIVVGTKGILSGGLFAILKNRKILIANCIEDIEKYFLGRKAASATIALDNQIFTYDNIQRIREVADWRNISIGFLYCQSVEEAIWSALKSKLYDELWKPEGSAWLMDYCTEFPEGNGLHYRCRRSVGNNIISSPNTKPYDLIGIFTHSNGMDTFLGKNRVLCSRKTYLKKTGRSLKVIPCFHGGRCKLFGMHVNSQPNETSLVHLSCGEEFFCQVLFMCTCYGLATKDMIFQQNLTQSHELLCSESVNALITSDRAVNASFEHVLFMFYLYTNGENLGSIVNCLNKFHRNVSNQYSPFILIGDPCIRISQNRLQPSEREWHKTKLRRFEDEIDLGEGIHRQEDLIITSVKIPSIHKTKENWPIYVGFEEPDASKDNVLLLKGILSPTGKEVILFNMRTKILSKKNHKIRLKLGYYPYRSVCKMVNNMIQQCRFWEVFLFNNQKAFVRFESVKQLASELLMSTTYALPIFIRMEKILNSLQASILYNTNPIKEEILQCYLYIGKLQESVISFIKEVSNKLWSMNIKSWISMYQSRDKESLWGECKYCGSNVYCIKYDSVVGDISSRMILECRRCRFISDISNLKSDVFLRGKSIVTQGRKLKQRLQVKNPEEQQIIVDVFIHLADHCHQHMVVTPCVRRNIQPTGKTTIDYEIETKDLPKGCYMATCIIIINGGYNQLQRFIYVS